MDQKIKKLLKKIPRAFCGECKSKKNSCNPMARCFECNGNFCYDHIWGGQIKEGMSKGEEVRSVCDACRKTYSYRTL